jgi:hypothetical protein
MTTPSTYRFRPIGWFYGPATDDYIHPYGHMTTGARRGVCNRPTALFSKGWVGPYYSMGGPLACSSCGREYGLWGGAPTLELSPYYS